MKFEKIEQPEPVTTYVFHCMNYGDFNGSGSDAHIVLNSQEKVPDTFKKLADQYDKVTLIVRTESILLISNKYEPDIQETANE